jgi:hypothetical protein
VVDSHALGEQNHSALRGRIRGAVASSIDSQDRSHVDDGPASSFSHRGKHGAGEQPKSTNIDIEGLVPLFFRDLLGGSNVKDSSIVQQNIEAAEMCHGLLDDAGNFVLGRHIRHQDETRVADLSRRFFQPFFPTTDQNDFGAFAGQSNRASAANAAARAGDDGDFVLEAGVQGN